MDPVRHIFMFRSILDKHNEDLNKKISEDMTRKSGMQTSLDKLGRIRVRFTSRPQNKQKFDGQDLEDRSSGGTGWSTSHPAFKSASEEEECLDEDPNNSVPEREKIHVENVNNKGEKLPEENANDNCNSNSAKELKKKYTDLGLWMSDLDDIRCRRSVNDRVIEGANKVLYVTHPYIGGLEMPLFVQLDNRFKKQPGEFVQMINIRDQPWVTITNVGCKTGEVLLCDSLYGFYNQQYPVRFLKAGDSMVCSLHTISALNVQQQSPGTLCGLFAIAFATSLCDVKDPSYIIYDEQNLCQDLESHLDNLTLENYGFSGNTIRSPRILFEIQVTPEMLINQNPLKRKGETATSSAAAKRQRLQEAKELVVQYCKKEMEHYQVYLEKSKNDPFYPGANAIYTFIKQNTYLNLPPADTKLILSNDLDFLDTLVRFHAEFQGLAIVNSKF